MNESEQKGIMNHLQDAHAEHKEKMYGDLPWKAWGSWFSWGSPVGLGLFFLSVGVLIVLLRYAFLMR